MRIGIVTGSGTYALPGLRRRAAGRRDPLRPRARQRGTLRRRRGAARLAPRRGPPRLSQPGHPPGEHQRAAGARRRRDPRRHGLRRGRPGARARVADRLRRPALPGQPAARRLALHAAHRARQAPAAGTGSSTGRSPSRCARRCSARRARRGPPGARRRLLRPRRRAAVQHAGRDPDARAAPASPRSSQTAGPETVLAGEAEIPYALLGYATDYANGVKPDEPTPVEELVRLIGASTRDLRARRSRPPSRASRSADLEPVGTHFRFD